MEQVQGVDVSWMTQGSPKDRWTKPSAPKTTPSPASPRHLPQPPTPSSTQTSVSVAAANAEFSNHAAQSRGKETIKKPQLTSPNGTQPQPIKSSPRRTSRSNSMDRQNGSNGSPLHRRGSWFSSISAKLSGSSNPQQADAAAQQPPPPQQQPQQPSSPSDPPSFAAPAAQEEPEQLPPPRAQRNAVLQAAARPEGNEPYTPAPPRNGQSGFLGVFRRLSSSSNAGQGALMTKASHGLVERKTLNIDQHRERCRIPELKAAKLRRVAFSVDVEIAPMPRYSDDEAEKSPSLDPSQKRKMTEKGEGEALKNPKTIEAQKEAGDITAAGQTNVDEPPTSPAATSPSGESGSTTLSSAEKKEKEPSRKKEKKKRNEEERKARKEKKRKLAEANGTIPIEIHYDSSEGSSIDANAAPTKSKTTTHPTTNPVRIYRRCCQLRETPILKKITEQLTDESNFSSSSGTVNKLDLTGYAMQLPDLITLGDYLAVVPVREILMEGTTLTDEGLRVILAGLLAAKRSSMPMRKQTHSLTKQGGMVERLVLRGNKLGPDGWKYLSLFLYLCKSLKHLDVSSVPFPRQAPPMANADNATGLQLPRTVAEILSVSIAERLGGDTLELFNMGGTEPSMEQLSLIMGGVIKCGVKRLGLAHNHLDERGMDLVAKYLSTGHREGLDLGGNDLRDNITKLASSLKAGDPLAAISLAACNLDPTSICKIFPVLAKLDKLRYIDLSHNHDMFTAEQSSVGSFRKWLPQMGCLRRIELQDCGLSSGQAIAIIEVLPEVPWLARVNLLNNEHLQKLADAKTEEQMEEACALFASMMAATRISTSLVCVDVEVPSDRSGEVVKAMAKQVVAYCLRNMENIPDSSISAAVSLALSETRSEAQETKPAAYSDVISHLVGHDVMSQDGNEAGDSDAAPDEDYVIGGTGLAKALTCCLENRGVESGTNSARQSGEFVRDTESGALTPLSRPRSNTGGSKAKDTSKHLLQGARKIRQRLQPALLKAKSTNFSDDLHLQRLTFLDNTLKGIIKRFEDEFPDTREDFEASAGAAQADGRTLYDTAGQMAELTPFNSQTEDQSAIVSDGEEEVGLLSSRPLSRSNSMLSRSQAEEEGRVHRAGHRLRLGVLRKEQIEAIEAVNIVHEISREPKHVRLLQDLIDETGGDLPRRAKEIGVVETFKENQDMIYEYLRGSDPEYWERFVESQKKSRANIDVGKKDDGAAAADESAIAD